MTVADIWLDDAFFDEPEPELSSLDGGTTNHGILWHAISPRWGHSMHTMCSYHGMFPPRLAHYFIQRYTQPGGLVLDPFSGRGTTMLQARVEGRRTISNDLSPLAFVLSAAKSNPVRWSRINAYIAKLENGYKRSKQAGPDVSEDIEMLFHPNTLRQLTYLRSHLLSTSMLEWTPEQFMLAGTVAGILHGAHRSDKTSMYLSISMPNTFSMPPAYVKKYIREKGLTKLDQDVFGCLRDKLARIYLDSTDGPNGLAFNEDASGVLNGTKVKAGMASLVLTSPPYLGVVNYGTSNWIRLWWLGIDDVSRHGGSGRRSLDAKLDHRHTYSSYREFMLRTLKGVRRVLRKDGVAVFVIGDVVKPNGPSYALGSKVWEDIGDQTGLRLIEQIDESLPSRNKVSRIWGDTKGNATDQECVLVLGRVDGEPANDLVDVEWDEPYKDAGPDAAHERLRRNRLASEHFSP